jgi:RHS repeat-associated protein
VSDLTDANGSSLAHYEFDPYGNTIVASGTQAVANQFRFSTKYTDDETRLLYYGHRYYSQQLGRWVSRDPIAEAGGQNLYAFLQNMPIDQFDLIGLAGYIQPPPGGWRPTPRPMPLPPPRYSPAIGAVAGALIAAYSMAASQFSINLNNCPQDRCQSFDQCNDCCTRNAQGLIAANTAIAAGGATACWAYGPGTPTFWTCLAFNAAANIWANVAALSSQNSCAASCVGL